MPTFSRPRFFFKLASIATLIGTWSLFTPPALGLPDERLRQRLEMPIQIHKNAYYEAESLIELYEGWTYELQWINADNDLNEAGQTLLDALENAHYLGLSSADYHIEEISSLINGEKKYEKGWAIDMDLLLTDALVRFLKHNYFGRVDRKKAHPEWLAKSESIDMLEPLRAGITRSSLMKTLKQSEPQADGYLRLKKYLKHLIDAEPSLDNKTQAFTRTLKLGDQAPMVEVLKETLSRLYDQYTPSENDVYDEPLKLYVKKFQAQHNIKTDGILGPNTYALLVKTSLGNIDTVRVNLERWRWMGRTAYQHYVSVNIPSYELVLYSEGKPQLSMEAIIGRNYRMTPVIEDQIRYVVVNPSWFVPRSIAVKDLLPKVQQNPNYFIEQEIEVTQHFGNEQKVIDSSSISWGEISSKNFNFRLRQNPGPKNALGKVKFMFPNSENVYIHDTNNPSLFSESERNFSSGCIRISKPTDLLYALLKDHPRISPQKISSTLDSGKETTLYLNQPVPIQVSYWTVWVDKENKTHYRHDLYQRDERILTLLNTSEQKR